MGRDNTFATGAKGTKKESVFRCRSLARQRPADAMRCAAWATIVSRARRSGIGRLSDRSYQTHKRRPPPPPHHRPPRTTLPPASDLNQKQTDPRSSDRQKGRSDSHRRISARKSAWCPKRRQTRRRTGAIVLSLGLHQGCMDFGDVGQALLLTLCGLKATRRDANQ